MKGLPAPCYHIMESCLTDTMGAQCMWQVWKGGDTIGGSAGEGGTGGGGAGMGRAGGEGAGVGSEDGEGT